MLHSRKQSQHYVYTSLQQTPWDCVSLPVGDCKVHVQWLAKVKLQALKQVWLQGHCNKVIVRLELLAASINTS